jgi:hypothetical protein
MCYDESKFGTRYYLVPGSSRYLTHGSKYPLSYTLVKLKLHVKFLVFLAVIMYTLAGLFWVRTWWILVWFIKVFEESFKDKDRDSIFLYNVGFYLAESSVSWPRTTQNKPQV